MDLSDLPEELVETVADYLSFEDICRCSQVNSCWRDALDINRVWKRFCTFHPKYFDKQISHLKCTPDVDFYQGCEAKERVFKELFVQRNLSVGNFHLAQVKCGSVYCDNVLDVVDDFGNHWLFVSCMEGTFFEREHKLQVLNMNEDPVLHTEVETPLGKVSRMLQSGMKMNTDKFYFIYQDTVLVYEFAHPLYELIFLYKICFEPLTVFPVDAFVEMKMVCMGNVVLGFLYTSFHITRTAPPFVHVWNEEGSLVFKEYGVPFLPQLEEDYSSCLNSYPVLEVKTSGTDKAVVVFQRFNRLLKSKFFTVRIFHVSSLQYTDFFIQKCKNLISVDICRNVVSLLYSKKERSNIASVKCYNTADGRAIFKAKFNPNRDSFHELVPNTEDGELVVLDNTNTFYVFDISLKKEMTRFKVSGKELLVTLIKNNLLLVESACKGRVIHEVWNFKCGQRLYVLDFSPALGIEQKRYSYSFIKNYCSPPKLVSFPHPMDAYPYDSKDTKIFIISFW